MKKNNLSALIVKMRLFVVAFVMAGYYSGFEEKGIPYYVSLIAVGGAAYVLTEEFKTRSVSNNSKSRTKKKR